MTVVSVGETIWDVIGEEEHLGGAAFNFAVHAARLGHEVLFVSGVGDDARGRRALEEAQALGLSTSYMKDVPQVPTGTATVELDSVRQPRFQIHRSAAYDCVALADDEFAAIANRRPDWIYFGTLHQVSDPAKELTARLVERNPRARRFYDVNLRPRCYTPALVVELAACATAIKVNESEAEAVAEWLKLEIDSTEDFCRQIVSRLDCQAVAVTRGANGCVMLIGDEYCDLPGVPVEVVDAVGAGDAFSAAFLHGIEVGWPVGQVAGFANRVGALVAGRPGATPAWGVDEIQPAAGE